MTILAPRFREGPSRETKLKNKTLLLALVYSESEILMNIRQHLDKGKKMMFHKDVPYVRSDITFITAPAVWGASSSWMMKMAMSRGAKITVVSKWLFRCFRLSTPRLGKADVLRHGVSKLYVWLKLKFRGCYLKSQLKYSKSLANFHEISKTLKPIILTFLPHTKYLRTPCHHRCFR